MEIFTGVLGFILFSFLFLLAILWFFLPFAIFGMKDRLDKIINLLKSLNEKLPEKKSFLDSLEDD